LRKANVRRSPPVQNGYPFKNRKSGQFICYKTGHFYLLLTVFFKNVSVAHDMSGFVARDLSGLRWSPMEVTDETDRDATGDPEDAI
jgi:hypothetical protein